jgi:hypothetical protein
MSEEPTNKLATAAKPPARAADRASSAFTIALRPAQLQEPSSSIRKP